MDDTTPTDGASTSAEAAGTEESSKLDPRSIAPIDEDDEFEEFESESEQYSVCCLINHKVFVQQLCSHWDTRPTESLHSVSQILQLSK